ncbi:MAG: hypothetical protein VYB54_07690 [Pseudomonadota bacterium]|nr:hypothetical protein [Pseudomonadota bacterium]
MKLLSDIEAFLDRTGMPPTTFGKSAVGDPNFVGKVRGGMSPRLNTFDRVRRFMASHDDSKGAAA